MNTKREIGWISPVTSLPEPEREVLVLTDYNSIPKGKDTPACPLVTIGWIKGNGSWTWIVWPKAHDQVGWTPTSVTTICPGNEYVKGWMPLPKEKASYDV